ncbi:hypothetical protein BD779DRAFT_1585717 [Infundibulicybe gibba]|nr:hypothetical protein BD779DRAFT_1585717 [Infundibulicybe gibba]
MSIGCEWVRLVKTWSLAVTNKALTRDGSRHMLRGEDEVSPSQDYVPIPAPRLAFADLYPVLKSLFHHVAFVWIVQSASKINIDRPAK